jgi:hypothetical protein
MRPSGRALAWSAYLVLAFALLAISPGPWYPLLVTGLGLPLAWLTLRGGFRWSPAAMDAAIVLALYGLSVTLFFVAFQVVTVSSEIVLFVIFGAGLLVGVVGSLVHVVGIQRRPLADLGLTSQRLPETLLLGLVLAGLQAALVLPLVSFGAPDGWLPLLALALMVGIYEAIFFRAYLMAVFEPMVGVVPAVGLAALLYGLYHVGYGMDGEEMLFLGGLGIVYTVAYAVVRNVLVLWPLLTPVGSFFANVRAGDIEMPMIAILGFVEVIGLMAVSIYLAWRWTKRHPVSMADPLAV